MLVEHPRKNNADVTLHINRQSKRRAFFTRLSLLLFALFHYDVFHFYYGISILPDNWDLPILRLFGKRIVMTYCGSDIRLLEVDKKRHHAPHLLEEAGYTEEKDKEKLRKMQWHRRWAHVITAPRNLYAYAKEVYPEEQISKVCLNNIQPVHEILGNGGPPAPRFNGGKKDELLVIHAPTNPKVKGTEIIEKAVQELKEEGLAFQYKRVEKMKYEEAKSVLAVADIVVDQVIVGGMGNLSLESLAMGKTLVVYLLDDIHAMLGGDVPIINVTPENVKEGLRRALSDETLRKELAGKGVEFVRKLVNVDEILGEVERIYGIRE